MEDKVEKSPQSSSKADLSKADFSRICGDGQDGATMEPLAVLRLMQILLEQKTENHSRKVLKTFGTSQHSSETWIQQPEQHHCLGKEPGSHGLEWLQVPGAGGSLSRHCHEEL